MIILIAMWEWFGEGGQEEGGKLVRNFISTGQTRDAAIHWGGASGEKFVNVTYILKGELARHPRLIWPRICILRMFALPEVGLHDCPNHFFDCLCFTHPEAQINRNGFPTETVQVDVLFNRLQNLPQVIYSHPGGYLLLFETNFLKDC